ncbi:hypothetical protein LEP1GSC047_4236 [Leptospira inadai serovar Lyme str. 10]|uniref:Uncharacterized protein n=1 Tax=Leptospira inadai serovar Lyme str. 10 TaxID=1049790 RepID=V6HMG8_9LEPT|nr:hypothetical protein LEP1GSC047_4236 [Leptospira inadai serovar Lyme str. 10]
MELFSKINDDGKLVTLEKMKIHGLNRKLRIFYEKSKS